MFVLRSNRTYIQVSDLLMMWRRVFPYLVASATGILLFAISESFLIGSFSGIVSGLYIFKPLILEKVDTETCVLRCVIIRVTLTFDGKKS